MNYSKYQEAIFNHIKTRCSNIYNGSEHAIVQAGPGSGKTTTIVQGTHYVPDFMSCMVGSFNKHIADNLRGKVNPHSSSTLNAIGWQACKAYDRNIIFDKFKTANILKEAVQPDHYWKLKGSVEKIVSLLKANFYTPDNNLYTVTNQIIDFHNIDIPVIENINFNLIMNDIYTTICNTKHILDFDDQKFMPIIYNWPLPKFDYLMIDEAQDLAPLDIELCRRMINKFSIFVGDEWQSIYLFRGSDPYSMKRIKEEFNCETLPLSICYRCPDAVIEEIQKINPGVEKPTPNPNGQGLVDEISKMDFRKISSDGDFVLCRITAPLVKECLKFLGMKKHAYVKGRDIGKNLIDLTDKVEPGNCLINVFNDKLDKYYSEKSSRLSSLNREYQLAELQDQVDSLREIMPLVKDVDGMIKLIKDMIPADEEGHGIVFMTMHRAKGLETKNVFILRRDLIPHFKAKTPEQQIQERNLLFIAQSRAQSKLYYILKEPGEK